MQIRLSFTLTVWRLGWDLPPEAPVGTEWRQRVGERAMKEKFLLLIVQGLPGSLSVSRSLSPRAELSLCFREGAAALKPQMSLLNITISQPCVVNKADGGVL